MISWWWRMMIPYKEGMINSMTKKERKMLQKGENLRKIEEKQENSEWRSMKLMSLMPSSRKWVTRKSHKSQLKNLS